FSRCNSVIAVQRRFRLRYQIDSRTDGTSADGIDNIQNRIVVLVGSYNCLQHKFSVAREKITSLGNKTTLVGVAKCENLYRTVGLIVKDLTTLHVSADLHGHRTSHPVSSFCGLKD
ncbi:hypothetical protein C0J52_21186, partial [Blattella germanica]